MFKYFYNLLRRLFHLKPDTSYYSKHRLYRIGNRITDNKGTRYIYIKKVKNKSD